MNQQPQQIEIKVNDEKLKGEYANLVQIMHQKEEFLLDFFSVFPPAGTLNSRVVLSPSHFKRMVKAMNDNLKMYEDKFGSIPDVEVPQQTIGFQPKQ
jgi:hypothetical protein